MSKYNVSQLIEKAMFVSLTISQWSARKYDKKISKEIDRLYNAEEAGRFNKRLLDCSELKNIYNIAQRIRTWHYQNTLLWLEGQNILPSANYFDYMKQFRDFKNEFDPAVKKFINRYQAMKKEAKKYLNGLYREDDYPGIHSLKSKFKCDVTISPMPSSDDFRISLSKSEIKKLSEDYENKIKHRLSLSAKELWKRVYDVTKNLLNQLEGAGGKGKYIRPGLITNIQELIVLLPKLNITGDQNLENMRRELEAKMVGKDAPTLNENEGLRKSTAKDVNDILKRMKGYV